MAPVTTASLLDAELHRGVLCVAVIKSETEPWFPASQLILRVTLQDA